MYLSAIIPTHDRPDDLRRCLETLKRQDIDPDAFEVLVLDDGSTMDIGALVADVAAGGSIQMRCERQAPSGLNVARNRGAAVTSGEVLAFLDDDTLVSPGWARALAEAFSTEPCAGAGGRIELQLAGPEPPWMSTKRCFLAEYDLGSEPVWLQGDSFAGGDPVPVGANCAVRRSEFDRVGGFRPGLDRFRGSLVSNGDTEFFHRLGLSGGRLRYVPDAHVLHCVPADRLTLRYFARRYYAQGISDELTFGPRGQPFSWRRRLGRGRYAVGGAKLLARDVLTGRGSSDGWFATFYWAGRFAAYRADRGPED